MLRENSARIAGAAKLPREGFVAKATSLVVVAAATTVITGAAVLTVATAASAETGGDASAEAVALAHAASSGHRVHVAADDTDTDTVYANPDGTLTREISQSPSRVVENGDLVPVNLNLEATDDGRLAPQAGATDVTISATGDGTLATLDPAGAGSFGISLDEDLSAAAVQGQVATYGISGAASSALEVTSLEGGFSANVVLSQAPTTAPTYTFPLQLNGLDASLTQAGQLELTNTAGKIVAESAPLRMWDSQVDAAGDPSNETTVDATLQTVNGQQVLTLTPSMSFLADPSTQYPVTIDPTVTATRHSDTYVSSANPDTQYWTDYRTRVGSPDGTGKFRSFELFEIDPFIGKDITSASLSLFQYYAATCTAKETDVYAVTNNPGTDLPATWNTQLGAVLQGHGLWESSATFNTGASSSCANGYETMDVTKQLNGYATGDIAGQWVGDPDDGKPYRAVLTLRAANETDPNGEKRFCSINWANAPTGSACAVGDTSRSPILSITYVPQLGVQGNYSLTTHGLNSISKLSVNNDDGNAVLTSKDLSISGIGKDLTLNRYYNSQRSANISTPSSLGSSGWSLGTGPDVYLEQNATYPERYQYHTETGTVLGDFVRKSTLSTDSDYTDFIEPAYGGIDATLKDNNDSTFTMTMHASQTAYKFADNDSSDNNLYLKQITDRYGNSITFNYVSGTHKLSSITDTAGRSLSVAYDSSNRITSITDSNGPSTRTWQYHYNSSGQLDYFKDPNSAQTDYEYTSGTPSYLHKVTDPAQTNGVRPTAVLNYSSGQVSQTQFQNGVDGSLNPTYYNFNFSYQSSPVSTCDSNATRSSQVTDATDVPGGTTTYCFTDRKRGGEQATDTYDGEGHHRTTSFTPDQKVSSFVTPDQQGVTSTHLSYADSPTDQLTSITEPRDTSGDIAAESVVSYNADASIPGYKYLPTSIYDSSSHCTAYTYWKSGDTGVQAVGAIKNAYLGANAATGGDCSGNTSTAQWHNDYNSRGQITDTYDANGSATSSGETRYIYWETGDTGIASHGVGELKQIIKPGGSCSSPRYLCTSYTYDGLGRVLTKTDGRGKVTSYSYDKDDRVTQVLSDGATTCNPTAGTCITYTYDNEGNVTTRADASGTTAFTYDYLNQQHTQLTPDATTITTSYDGVGNLKEYDQSVTSGVSTYNDTVTYSYNDANELVDVVDNTGTSYARDMQQTRHNNGKLDTITFPTSPQVTDAFTYKASGKADTDTVTAGTNQLFKHTYSYKQSGFETDKLQTLTTTGPTNMDPGTITYGYNARNQLTSSADSNSSFSDYTYAYDDAGNLTHKTIDASDTYYGYDATGDLCWKGSTNGTQHANTCPSTPTGDTTYTHDDAGNNTGTSANPVAYNALGQASSLNGVSQSYLDQTNDLRVTSGSVRSITGPLGITARITTSGGQPTFYTRDETGKLLDQHGPSAVGYLYYARDSLGSTAALVGPDGAIKGSYVYNPYGGTTVNNVGTATAGSDNPFRYRGGYQDATEGDNYYHFGARYYDPSTTQWTQPDPKAGAIARPASLESYAYAEGDPINRSDLSGNSIGDIFVGIGSAFTDATGAFLLADGIEGLAADSAIEFGLAVFGVATGGAIVAIGLLVVGLYVAYE